MHKRNIVTPEQQLTQLSEELTHLKKEYERLWNQHKLLRLSYRSVKMAQNSKPRQQKVKQTQTLKDAFNDLLYGSREEQAVIRFTHRLKGSKRIKAGSVK